MLEVQILNSFSGDDKSEIETSSSDGREQAAKLVNELLRSGSAVFLEKEINGVTHTYRVKGYDPETNKLTIRLDGGPSAAHVEPSPKRGRGHYRRSSGTISAETGRIVAVAPRSGG